MKLPEFLDIIFEHLKKNVSYILRAITTKEPNKTE